MKITNLRAAGLKGLAFDHELGPVTVFSGPNYAGKSARLEAIRLGLIGYVPELGKTKASTMELSAGDLTVELTMDDGTEVLRSWNRKDKVEVGRSLHVPPVLMDPNEYFALGAKDRVRYVYGLASGTMEPSGIVGALVSNVHRIKAETEHHVEAVQSLAETILSMADEREEKSQPVHEWVGEVIQHVTDELRAGRAAQKTMEEGAKARATLAMDEETPRDVSGQIVTLQQQVADLKAEQRQHTEVVDRARANADKIARLNGILARPDPGPEIVALRATVESLDQQIEAYVSPAAGIRERHGEAKARQAVLRSELATLSTQLTKALADVQAIVGLKECPTCGACGEGWRAKLDTERRTIVDVLQANAKIKAVEWDELEAVRPTLQADLDAAERADREHATRQAQLRQNRQALDRLLNQSVERASAAEQLAGLGTIDSTAAQLALTEIGSKLQGHETTLARLQEQQRAFARHQQDEARQAQALLAAERSKARVEVLKAALDMLEEFQGALVERAFGALLSVANQMTHDLMPGRLEYQDGDIGRTEDGRWISHRTFSGTEKAMTYAALSVALANGSPIKLVMMDELGRMSRETRSNFLERMVALTKAGLIDQFVGAGTEIGDVPDGVTIIDVEEAK